MIVAYMAHPAGAATKELHLENLARAKRWFKWIADQGYAVIADWIIYCEVWNDFDAELRNVGLEHGDAMIKKCDVFIMCGGEVSSGMQRGMMTARYEKIPIIDISKFVEPPKDHILGANFPEIVFGLDSTYECPKCDFVCRSVEEWTSHSGSHGA